MECFNCGSENVLDFFEEVFPCAHCDESNVVVYSFCKSCGAAFKSVNDVIVNGATFTQKDVLKMTGLTADAIDQHMAPTGHLYTDMVKDQPRTMREVVHSCLRCESTSFEVQPGKYCCSDPECGFEWEIV